MNDKIVVDLTQAIMALNKSILLQYQSKTVSEDQGQNTKRRKDVPLVKLSDSGAVKEIRGLLADMYKELQQLNAAAVKGKTVKGGSPTANTEAARRLTGSLNNLTKSSTSLDAVFNDLGEDIDDVADGLDRLSRIQQELIRQQSKAVGGYDHMRKEMGKFSASLRNGGGGGNGGNGTKQPAKDDPSEGSTTTGNLIDSLFKSFKFSDGVKGALGDAALAARTGAQYNIIDTTIQASSMGMAVKDFIEFGAQFRTQAMRLTGGMKEWMAAVKTSQMDLLAYTGGDMQQAAQVYGNMAGRFMDLGFGLDEANKMIGSGSSGYVGVLKKLTHATGKSIEQLDDTIGGLLSSDVIRDGMLKLDRENRKQYLSNQVSMIHNMTMVTGSLERARAIVDEMNKRQNMSAVDRYRDAAKSAAISVAMGLSGSEAMERFKLQTLRPENMTKSQNERLAELNDKLSRGYESRVGSGNLAMEMIMQSLAKQTGVDMKSLSVYNTSADNKLNSATVAKQQTSSLTSKVDNPEIKELVSVARIIQQSLGSNLANIILGGFAAVIAAMGAKGIFDYRTAIAGRGAGAGTGAGTPGTAKTGPGILSRLKSSVTPARASMLRGGLAGVASYAGFYAMDKVWQPETAIGQTAKHYMNEASTATSIGIAIGTAIAPGVGTAIGGLAGMAIGVMMADPPSQITQYALAAERLATAADVEIGMANKRHQIQLNNLDQYSRGMSAKDLEYFNRSIAMIEKEHGVRITSVNDLNRYASDSLKSFIAQRNSLLQREHNAEMDAIKIKKEAIQRNVDTIRTAQQAVDARDAIKDTDISSMFSVYVDSTDMEKISKLLNPNLSMDETLMTAYTQLSPSTIQQGGFSPEMLSSLLYKLSADIDVPYQSAEGKLAQSLHKAILDDATKRADVATGKATAINANNRNNLFDQLSIHNASDAAKRSAVSRYVGSDIESVMSEYNAKNGTNYTTQNIMDILSKNGQTYIPELDQMISKAASGNVSSVPRLFDMEQYWKKPELPLGKTPLAPVEQPTIAADNLNRAADSLLAASQVWSNGQKASPTFVSPEMLQEMQRVNMNLLDMMQLLSEQINRTSNAPSRPNTFRGPLAQ